MENITLQERQYHENLGHKITTYAGKRKAYGRDPLERKYCNTYACYRYRVCTCGKRWEIRGQFQLGPK